MTLAVPRRLTQYAAEQASTSDSCSPVTFETIGIMGAENAIVTTRARGALNNVQACTGEFDLLSALPCGEAIDKDTPEGAALRERWSAAFYATRWNRPSTSCGASSRGFSAPSKKSATWPTRA